MSGGADPLSADPFTLQKHLRDTIYCVRRGRSALGIPLYPTETPHRHNLLCQEGSRQTPLPCRNTIQGIKGARSTLSRPFYPAETPSRGSGGQDLLSADLFSPQKHHPGYQMQKDRGLRLEQSPVANDHLVDHGMLKV